MQMNLKITGLMYKSFNCLVVNAIDTYCYFAHLVPGGLRNNVLGASVPLVGIEFLIFGLRTLFLIHLMLSSIWIFGAKVITGHEID